LCANNAVPLQSAFVRLRCHDWAVLVIGRIILFCKTSSAKNQQIGSVFNYMNSTVHRIPSLDFVESPCKGLGLTGNRFERTCEGWYNLV